jgi:trehalose 6-phosphate synthase
MAPAVDHHLATSSHRTSMIVLANRAPYRHERAADGSVRLVRSASGLVTALEPLVEAMSGTWIAHGDVVDVECTSGRRRGTVSGSPRYGLRYVSFGQAEYDGFYAGFANEALWPLCHSAHVQPVFRTSDFHHYQSANRRFAAAVCEEAGDDAPVILVQDYHMALAPAVIRRGSPQSAVVTFWHIPWPHVRAFRTCPWAATLLEGMLGSDVIGLQTDDDCRNFLAAVHHFIDADVDESRGEIRYAGRAIRVRAYPVGVPWNPPLLRSLPPAAQCREQILHGLGLPAHARIGIGVDRLDYTKGIAEKFQAIEHLLERQPELRGVFAFVQVAEPSRTSLAAYQETRIAAEAAAARVNARFGSHGYRPILLLDRHFDGPEVYRMYRAADVCFVNSLDDGMNLVAKEFASAREDEQGVLVLSQFAGASQQLTSALLVNPYAPEQSARTLADALAMPAAEQARRMRAMRAVVAESDTSQWAEHILRDARLQHGRARAHRMAM